MNTRIVLVLGIWLCTVSLPMTYGGDSMLGANPANGPDSYRSVNATVSRVVSGMVFFKTDENTTRNSSLKEIARSGIASVHPGDEVKLVVDRGNSILAITKGILVAGEITGTVHDFDHLNRKVTIETAGKSRSFDLKDAAATKLSGLKEERLTLVMDKENRVMDVYRPN